MKKRLLIIYDVKGWAYYNRARALQKNAPDDFEVDISRNYNQIFQKGYDAILLLPFIGIKKVNKLIKVRYYRNCSLPIIVAYNLGWDHDNNRSLDKIYSDCQHIIINNKTMYDNYPKKDKTFYIPNGVDLDVFSCDIPMSSRKIKIGWVGSNFHAGNKGYYDLLPSIGKFLDSKDIEYEWVKVNSNHPPYTSEEMRHYYNTLTALLVCSRYEGTPNPALEAAACGCPIITTPVGNMPELIKDGVNGFLCERNMTSFIQAINKTIANREEMSKNAIKLIKEWDWKNRSPEYFDYIRKAIALRHQQYRQAEKGLQPKRQLSFTKKRDEVVAKVLSSKQEVKRTNISGDKTILLARPLRGIGGAELTSIEYALNLEKIGFKVKILWDDETEEAKSFNSYNKLGRYDQALERLSISRQDVIKNVADFDYVYILHRHFFDPKLAVAINKIQKKIVYVPGKNPWHVKGCGHPKGNKKELIGGISYFIFNSMYYTEYHTNNASKFGYSDIYVKKFKHLYPPLNREFYDGVLNNRKELMRKVKSKLPVDDRYFKISVFGRLISSKFPCRAIEIAHKFQALSGLKVFIIFVGDGPMREEVVEKARSLGVRIHITGLVNEPFGYLFSSNCVLHCCQIESLSRALREAMYLGIPVIAPHTAGNIELCKTPKEHLLYRDNNEACHKLLWLTQKDRYRKFRQDQMAQIKRLEDSNYQKFADFFNNL